MSFRVTFDTRSRRLVVTPAGPCGMADSLALMRELAAHPSLPEVTGLLAETGCLGWAPAFDEAEQLADDYARGPLGRLPVAVVAPGDLLYAVSSQWATMAGLRGATARTFRTRADAEAWLAEALEPAETV
jgi:hypothetical protein